MKLSSVHKLFILINFFLYTYLKDKHIYQLVFVTINMMVRGRDHCLFTLQSTLLFRHDGLKKV